jgi:MoxR-like ATPase
MTSKNQDLENLKQNINSVIIGKSDVIDLALISILARGHILIEDVPGVGKTSLACALAQSLDLSFKRIQFTNDILPSDIVGVSIYDSDEKRFRFNKGPIFSNLVLAYEINRSSPRTQSALLEAMNENQATIDNETHELDSPFIVIATQNPIESHGAFPLPESQLDRFMMYISMGYPAQEDERKILRTKPGQRNPKNLKPVIDKTTLLKMQSQVDEVVFESVLIDYVIQIVTATRNSNNIALGVSPRGGLILQQAARARAFLSGRDYCIPDDVKQLAVPVLCHRIIPQSRNGANSRKVSDTAPLISEIIENQLIPI